MQIFCDSSCDLLNSTLEKINVKPIVFPYSLNGDEQTEIFKSEEDFDNFYAAIRSGKTPKTAGINAYCYEEKFAPVLAAGEDILYVHLSSGLTGTFNFKDQIISDLKQQFPSQKVVFVDSLQVSYGVAELVFAAASLRDKGLSITEIEAELNRLKSHISTCFIPESLFYLQKGGRISLAAAIGGTLLNVRPVIKVTDEGKLQKIGVVAGRKAAIKKLAAIAAENIVESNLPVGIMHACCEEDALLLKDEAQKLMPNKNFELRKIGPTIGTYCGPGTLGIIFNSKQR